MSGEDGVRSGREYPLAPIAGVAAVVLYQGEVLLIRRGREPMLGAWSLPGGVLELGETSAEGAVREVLEETGVPVRAVEVITSIDRIYRDAEGRVQFHYLLVDWLCVSNERALLRCGDDAAEARWVPREEIFRNGYDLEEVTLDVIRRAFERAEAF